MKRCENWPSILSGFLKAREGAPFVWGENDCCLFAADAILAITGEDVAADVRGVYTTEAEAEALVEGAGGLAALAARAGERCLPSEARRGDVVLTDQNCLGIVDDSGRRVAVYVEGRGLSRLPASCIRSAWRVG
jgi:hypothetical protein